MNHGSFARNINLSKNITIFIFISFTVEQREGGENKKKKRTRGRGEGKKEEEDVEIKFERFRVKNFLTVSISVFCQVEFKNFRLFRPPPFPSPPFMPNPSFVFDFKKKKFFFVYSLFISTEAKL